RSAQSLGPREARRRASDGRAPLLRPPHRRGEPAHRRVHAKRESRRSARGSRPGLRVLSTAQAASRIDGGIHIRRRAADDRDRARPHGAAAHDPARRTVHGARTADRRGDLRDREEPEHAAEGELPARRAEHHGGAAVRRFRLHPGERPGRARGDREVALRERGREGVLPGHLEWRAQELPGDQKLPAPQALAGLMFYDALDSRPHEEREAELMRRLPELVAHAKANAPFYRELFAAVDSGAVTSRAALAALPLTRKSELVERQRAVRPFGGLNA